MKNFRSSDYAYNKACPDEIVYHSSTGENIRLTVKDFASEEEFRKWKEYSDESYHAEQKADDMFSKKTSSIVFIEETDLQVEEAHDVVAEHEESARLLAEEVRKMLEDCLTEKQLRRLIQSVVYGMTQEQIALLESNKHQAVSQGIQTAKRRVQNYFEKNYEKDSKKPCKNASQIPLSERVNFIKLQHEKELAKLEQNKESKKES